VKSKRKRKPKNVTRMIDIEPKEGEEAGRIRREKKLGVESPGLGEGL